MRILLVEDDQALGSAIREHAEADGHAVDWAKDLAEARHYASVVGYEFTLLDILLPDGNGIDYLRDMGKRLHSTSVIAMTALDSASHMIEVLDAGADDYVVKPFNLDQLCARIRAVARRRGHYEEPTHTVGALTIHLAERRLYRAGQYVCLTSREWAVLGCLLRRSGTVVPKAKIEDALYCFGSEIESNTVEVYVHRLRKKIGVDRIATERGLGYRIVIT
ncbi:response regulator transcription factor [Sinorhizobium meliloti]|uniref:response regulator transcription factor n=1 Tax=Rhizobium meliloti TaxID=382 RepID=UPI000D1E62F5|nr:response regulator transcription factor [Sinorhizobium meliloti]RMI14796.1 DNA-binding response regulator [Sinorhizobium meliloti]